MKRVAATTTIATGVALSAVLLWWAVRNVDAAAVIEALRRATLPWVGAFLVSIAAFCWTKAARWRVLLAPAAPVRTRSLLSALLIGTMGNLFLPLQLGEAVRAYLIAKSTHVRLITVLMTLLVERVLDLLFALLLIAAAFAAAGAILDAQRDVALTISAMIAVPVLGAAACAVFPDFAKRLLDRAGTLLPRSLQPRLAELLKVGAAGAQSLRERRTLLQLMSLTALQLLLMLTCCWASIAALGINVPAHAAIVVMALAIIAMAIPAAPGYVGNIQAAYGIGLAGFGVSASDALAASMVYHALLVLWFGISGLISMRQQRLHWADWKQSQRAVAERKEPD
jgi:glycosyltransferase 2 family protein